MSDKKKIAEWLDSAIMAFLKTDLRYLHSMLQTRKCQVFFCEK